MPFGFANSPSRFKLFFALLAYLDDIVALNFLNAKGQVHQLLKMLDQLRRFNID